MRISLDLCSGPYEQAFIGSLLIALAIAAICVIVLMRDKRPLSVKGRRWLPVVFACGIYIIAGVQLSEDFGICVDRTPWSS